MGTGKAAHLVNVIDFGLAKKFRDPRTSNHIPYKQDGYHGVGTSLFAAINTHLGVESSRRDDLESLAYMLVYFLRGSLPWRKLRAPATLPVPTTKASRSGAAHPQHAHPYNPVSATWDLIRDAKIAAEPMLTAGLPPEFDVLFRYARGLEFDDLPDYEGLRGLFRGLAERVGVKYDSVFDWSVPGAGETHKEGGATKATGGHGGGSVGGGRRFCEACNARNNAHGKR